MHGHWNVLIHAFMYGQNKDKNKIQISRNGPVNQLMARNGTHFNFLVLLEDIVSLVIIVLHCNNLSIIYSMLLYII